MKEKITISRSWCNHCGRITEHVVIIGGDADGCGWCKECSEHDHDHESSPNGVIDGVSDWIE